MTRRNIANILTCFRRVWAVYKRGILLLLLLLSKSVCSYLGDVLTIQSRVMTEKRRFKVTKGGSEHSPYMKSWGFETS